MDSNKQIYSIFEWEGLQSKVRASRLQHSGRLLSGSATATIERNESYGIHCEVQGFTADYFKSQIEFQQLLSKPGWIDAFEFTGDCNGYAAVFSNCCVNGIRSSLDCDSGTYKNNSFLLSISTDLFERRVPGTGGEATHIDWFLNGPRDFIYSRTTLRQFDHGYSRAVNGLQNYELSSGYSRPGSSADCVYVQLADFSFLLRLVDDDFGPTWSKNFAIEYSNKLSSIPNEEIRKAVAEIVSFVFGRKLIDIGDTSFSNEGWEFFMQNWKSGSPLSSVKIKSDTPYLLRSWNPRGIHVRTLCSKIDYPPILIERMHRKENQNIEAVLTMLVPAYLKYRDLFSLDNALWRYWTFQEMPLGVNLPMLVSGIEILMKAWFNSPKSKSHGNFTSKEKFDDILRQDFVAIRTKLVNASKTDFSLERLKNQKTLEALMDRMQNSFEMGIAAKTRQFFEELGWEPLKNEMEALRARSKQIHGHSEKEDVKQLWFLSESIRTLFHKIMLSLLGYSGEYFDYANREVKGLSSRHPC